MSAGGAAGLVAATAPGAVVAGAALAGVADFGLLTVVFGVVLPAGGVAVSFVAAAGDGAAAGDSADESALTSAGAGADWVTCGTGAGADLNGAASAVGATGPVVEADGGMFVCDGTGDSGGVAAQHASRRQSPDNKYGLALNFPLRSQ